MGFNRLSLLSCLLFTILVEFLFLFFLSFFSPFCRAYSHLLLSFYWGVLLGKKGRLAGWLMDILQGCAMLEQVDGTEGRGCTVSN